MAEVAGLILTDIGGTAFDYVAIGTSNTAESKAHTALQAQAGNRGAGVGTRVTTTDTDDTAQWVYTFDSTDGLSGSQTIQEAGVFNAAAAGVMLFRKIFTGKVCDWDAGDTLEITAKCQVKQGA